MKKIFIGSVVGAVILFIWSFLAWAVLPIHAHTLMYTPAQDTILSVLEHSYMQTGVYAMPMADNRNITGFDSKYQEESQKVMEENKGLPMATIYYLKEGYDMSGLTMLKGFLFNFIACLAACIFLVPAFSISKTFFSRWWLTLVAALFVNACAPLIQFNWMGVPWSYTVDMVVDNFLNWGIVGLWFAYYFNPQKK